MLTNQQQKRVRNKVKWEKDNRWRKRLTANKPKSRDYHKYKSQTYMYRLQRQYDSVTSLNLYVMDVKTVKYRKGQTH